MSQSASPAADDDDVGTAGIGGAGRWYVVVAGLLTAAHPVLPIGWRAVNYLLVAAWTIFPLSLLLRRQAKRDRAPWWTLVAAMVMLIAGKGLTAVAGAPHRANSDTFLTIGHALLLVAAILMVVRRGRRDVGGLIDVSVRVVGLLGLVWTTAFFPRLLSLGVTTGNRTVCLVIISVLTAVLGALYRVQQVSRPRLATLNLLMTALVLSLIGNSALALWPTVQDGLTGAVETGFLVAYICMGLAALHPSVHELAQPGPAPDDRLSVRRLGFLGLSLAAAPVAAGVRVVLGLPVDGPILVASSLLIVPLVMIRIGRLAQERERAEVTLLHQATHDNLTGLANRAEMMSRLQAALGREQAGGVPAVVLLFCDLNGFKEVNDRLGHAVGDRLLVQVAARIAGVLGAGDTLARYGGDEFLVLHEETQQAQAVLRLRERIDRVLEPPFELAGTQVRIGCSVGAVISDGDLSGEDLIIRADQAMYQAKPAQRAAA